MLLLSLGLACLAPDADGGLRLGPGDGDTGARPEGGDGGAGSGGDSGDAGDTSGCPAEMVAVEGWCIDRVEARLAGWSPYEVPEDGVAVVEVGEVPQAYISGEVAAAACAAAGKRLCTPAEWRRSCEGPAGWTYPYGQDYDPAACNTEYAGDHPVIDYYGTAEGVWDAEHMNAPGINQQPGTVAAAGAHAACRSAEGALDLHGNLHEWVADAEGTFLGGFYADAAINGAGCGYTTTAHAPGYHDYSTGFRCCADR